MAFLYVNEFENLDGRATVDVVHLPPMGPSSALAIAASPGTSVVLSKTTRFIRLQSDAPCSIKVSRGPVAAGVTLQATATDMRIAANAMGEMFAVSPGSTLNVITNT
jgi:hypothetical protein